MAGVLRPGARGPRVRELQERLARLGFYLGPLNGYYGPLTQDAVKRMQRAFRLHHDGVAGPQVWSVLTDELLPLAIPEAPQPAGDGAPGVLPRLLLGLLETGRVREPMGSGSLPGHPSGWVVPWAELRAGDDGSGEVSLLEGREAPGEGLRVRAVLLGRSGGRRFWRSAHERLLAELRRLGPGALKEPLLLAASGTLPPLPGDAPPPAGGEGPLVRLARLLTRRGLRVWLALAVPTRITPLAAYWRGYHLGRLCAGLQRLVIWAPPPHPEGRAGLATLNGWLRGLRAAHPPWRTLVALDLWAWLYEPDARGRLVPSRRLSHEESVLWAWRHRTGKAGGGAAGDPGRSVTGDAAGQTPPEPVLARREPQALRQLLLQLRWGGVGGVLAAGLAGSDPICREVLFAVLPPLSLSPPGISMERTSGEGGAPGVSQDPGRAGGAHPPPGRAYR